MMFGFRSPKSLVLSAILLSSVSWLPPLQAQQAQPSPTSEYQYKKDYAQVEGIMKETDPEKRAQLLLAFVKEHPQSRMIPYVSGYYSQIVAPLQQAGAWAKVIAMNEAFLALVPDDKAALGSLVGAYFQTQNFAKTAEYGEKFYVMTPDKSVAFILATSYFQLKNTDNFMKYAEKVLAEFPTDQVYTMALQVAGTYAAKKDLTKAAEQAQKVLTAFGEKVPQGVQEKDWNVTRSYAHTLIAASLYEKKEYPKAIEQYEKAAKFAPHSDEPYYFIGMSKWNGKDHEGAIAAFAKATVLNKQYAKRAQDNLEKLYKPLHNDTLDGLDEVKAKAKSELGIS